MQLQIKTKLDVIKKISTNFPEVKKFYLEKLDAYKGLTYGETQIKEAKVDRASLNKEIKTLKSIITETKKVLLNPMNELDTNIKELVLIVEGVSSEIDLQVRDAEEKARAKKYDLIKLFFNEANERFPELKLEKIWQDNWMLVTYSMKNVQADIATAIGYFAKEIDVITGMRSKFEDKLKEVYFETMDLAIVMRKKNDMEEAERVVLAKQEEEKIEKPVVQTKEDVVVKVLAPTEIKSDEFEVILRITATIGQLNSLKEFCNMAQIKYEKM